MTRHASGQDATAARVLLVVKYAFVAGKDGTSVIVQRWYDVLRALGLRITVLSFNYLRERWKDEAAAALTDHGARVTLVDIYGAGATARLRRAGIAAHGLLAGHRFAPEWIGAARPARASLNAALAEPFDLILLQGVDTIHLVGEHRLAAHPARKLLDLHDHMPTRIVQLRRALSRIAWWQPHALRRSIGAYELTQALTWPSLRRLIRAEHRRIGGVDLVCCSSAAELAVLREGGLPADRLCALPWPIATAELPPRGEPPSHDFGFIGSDALFNVEALLFLLRAVWPRIRAAMPAARLLVAGSVRAACRNLPAALRGGVETLGWVEDVGAFYADVRVVLVPLVSGTGVSIKTMEAAAYGAAIVSTSAGVRGLALAPGAGAAIEDNAEGFAAAAVRLAGNPQAAAALGQEARRVARQVHDPAAFAAAVQAVMARLGVL